MNYIIYGCSFIVLFLIGADRCTKSLGNPKEDTKLSLVWADEFDYEGVPDSTRWRYDLGDGCPQVCGWGNKELQYYTNHLKNAKVQDGFLHIEARKEAFKDKAYTSTRLLSKGDWDHGRLEIRAKLPKGKGTWPAIWMLPINRTTYGTWPACGEIDIMEHVGYEPDTIYGTVHTQAYNHMINTQRGGQIFVPNSEDDFHIYTIEWSPKRINWLVDNVQYHTFANENATYKEWPFDQPFHLILNIAVGGNWGGKMGVDETIWPQKMLVDYVRVWQ